MLLDDGAANCAAALVLDLVQCAGVVGVLTGVVDTQNHRFLGRLPCYR